MSPLDADHAAVLREQRHLPDLDHARLAASRLPWQPLTNQVDALRALTLSGGASAYGSGLDVGILTAVTAALIGLASCLYPKIVI